MTSKIKRALSNYKVSVKTMGGLDNINKCEDVEIYVSTQKGKRREWLSIGTPYSALKTLEKYNDRGFEYLSFCLVFQNKKPRMNIPVDIIAKK